jgi:hypothetical protein
MVFDRKQYMKEYNARPETKQKVRDAMKRIYHDNKDNPEFLAKRNEGVRQWRIKYPERKKRIDKEYYEKNKDILVPKRKEYYQNNKDMWQNGLWFMDKWVPLGFNPRKGICSLCDYHGLTHIHHNIYDLTDPLAFTIELCNPCHRREHCHGGGPILRSLLEFEAI